MDTELRHRQRNGDHPRLHGPEERDHIFETLWREDGGALARLTETGQLVGDHTRALVDLRPGQRLGVTRRVNVVVQIGEGGVIGLLLRAGLKGSRDRRKQNGHYVTFPLSQACTLRHSSINRLDFSSAGVTPVGLKANTEMSAMWRRSYHRCVVRTQIRRSCAAGLTFRTQSVNFWLS